MSKDDKGKRATTFLKYAGYTVGAGLAGAVLPYITSKLPFGVSFQIAMGFSGVAGIFALIQRPKALWKGASQLCYAYGAACLAGMGLRFVAFLMYDPNRVYVTYSPPPSSVTVTPAVSLGGV